MGGQSSSIDTSSVKIQQIKATIPIQQGRFCPPFRKFTNQIINIDGRRMNAVLEVQEPSKEKIKVQQDFFRDLEDAFDYKTKEILLSSVLTDEHYIDLRTFIGTKEKIDLNTQPGQFSNSKPQIKDVTLQLKPFSTHNSFHFNNILYQIHMNEEIAKLNCRNLNTIIDKYAIQTGLQVEGEEFPFTQVFQISSIATNLSEMIRYRRENKWPWTTNQFNALASDLANAVKALHSVNISHNDIRPCNVYYSQVQNCYQLGSFGNAVRCQPGNLSGSVNQLRASTLFGAPELSLLKQANFQQADIYSLGMTLLCAFYLCQPIDRNAVDKYNNKFERTYPVMSALRQMIMPIDKRSNIETLIQHIPKGQHSEHMKNLISSLRYKNRPKDKRLVLQKKMLSDGYQRLGLWNQWRNLNFQAYQLQENSLDDYKRAISLFQLAKIESCRGEDLSAHQYAKSASKIFRGVGHEAFQQGNINEAVNFYSKAIQCSKYFQNKYDIDTAKNLLGLALAHSQKGQYQISKPLINQSKQIIVRNAGRDSIDYCKVRISQAKIERQFYQYNEAQKILQQCLSMADKKSNLNQELGLKLKAQILHELGQCLMLKASQNNNMEQFEKSQQKIASAIAINNQFPDNHIFLAQNIEKLGQIELRKKNCEAAKNNFIKATEIRQQYINENKSTKQEIAKIEKSHASNLCLIADCEKELGNHPQALKNYNLALEKYRTLFGSDHNKQSAVAIGNMAKVYHRMNDKAKAKDCLKVAMQILLQTSGGQDPDYQYFQEMSNSL